MCAERTVCAVDTGGGLPSGLRLPRSPCDQSPLLPWLLSTRIRTNTQVRVAIASQLHLMARQAAPSDAARLLRRPLSSLLRDGSAAVREALLSGLADTLLVCRMVAVWVLALLLCVSALREACAHIYVAAVAPHHTGAGAC
jgi:hypothetical protein